MLQSSARATVLTSVVGQRQHLRELADHPARL
jgi:hypothetical protein